MNNNANTLKLALELRGQHKLATDSKKENKKSNVAKLIMTSVHKNTLIIHTHKTHIATQKQI